MLPFKPAPFRDINTYADRRYQSFGAAVHECLFVLPGRDRLRNFVIGFEQTDNGVIALPYLATEPAIRRSTESPTIYHEDLARFIMSESMRETIDSRPNLMQYTLLEGRSLWAGAPGDAPRMRMIVKRYTYDLAKYNLRKKMLMLKATKVLFSAVQDMVGRLDDTVFVDMIIDRDDTVLRVTSKDIIKLR